MADAPDAARLCGRWLHSHEEDAGGAQVFRPSAHALPPSRGRLCLELRRDGTLLETRPGADDRPRAARGRWELAGNRLRLYSGPRAPARELEVIALEPDRLVLRRGR